MLIVKHVVGMTSLKLVEWWGEIVATDVDEFWTLGHGSRREIWCKTPPAASVYFCTLQ
jgi:hypothetical protein